MFYTFAQFDCIGPESGNAPGSPAFQRRTSPDTLNGPELQSPSQDSGPILSSTRRILERSLGVPSLWEHWEASDGDSEAA